MSRFMQIEIRIKQVYEAGFASDFPRIADFLRLAGYGEVLEAEPSFYALVDRLEMLARDPHVPEQMKPALKRLLPVMLDLRNKARETLLQRELDALDRLLYQLEDAFEDLESQL
ncbi:conserved hypothetical protein [uncultured Desulfatiglans sp.]|nr:conserved hypothetical protein [uncultured Desulfatiglans sp.]